MTTLHIMLASGENLPNLIPAITSAFKADVALILTSADMRNRAQILKSALEFSGVRRTSIHSEDCPDRNVQEIRVWAEARADEIVASYRDSRRILNLTGGTKLMMLAFLEAFRNRGMEAIYCDTDHGHIEYLYTNRQASSLPVNVLKLKSCLAAQGYKFREKTPDAEGLESRKELTQRLVAHAPRIEKLIQKLNGAWYEYDARRNLQATVAVGGLDGEEKRLLETMRDLDLLDARGVFRNEMAARYLGGGWLEEWCWQVGRDLEGGEEGKRLRHDRWGIGLEIEPFDAPRIPGKNFLLNELDAVIVHRNRMLLIECKTGTQIADQSQSQHILNKLDALGDQFGGRLSTRWLLTARQIRPDAQARERARRYRIRIIEPRELILLKEKVQEWMTSR
jgi:hypothetical protein